MASKAKSKEVDERSDPKPSTAAEIAKDKPIDVTFSNGEQFFAYNEKAVPIRQAVMDVETYPEDPDNRYTTWYAEVFEATTDQTLWRSRQGYFKEEEYAVNAAHTVMDMLQEEYGFSTERLQEERVLYFKWLTETKDEPIEVADFEAWVEAYLKKDDNGEQARQTDSD